MTAIVITAASLIWPLLVLLVGAIVWHTRGRHARQKKLATQERRRALVVAKDAQPEEVDIDL